MLRSEALRLGPLYTSTGEGERKDTALRVAPLYAGVGRQTKQGGRAEGRSQGPICSEARHSELDPCVEGSAQVQEVVAKGEQYCKTIQLILCFTALQTQEARFPANTPSPESDGEPLRGAVARARCPYVYRRASATAGLALLR